MDVSAVELAGRIASGETTAASALQSCRAQVEAENPSINAFVTLDWEAAEARALELDGTTETVGPLHGLPIAIKDIFPTKNLRTTYGSLCFADHLPQEDALHVARLREAGAVIIGKSNTPEFAYSGQTSNLLAGTTCNPFNQSRTVAGSSGGAAAALAARMVALADGSDLAGSLRAPAAWCGVVGYRPTSGLIPLQPNPAPFDGLHVPGPMGRTVADVILMTRVMAGNSRHTPQGYWRDLSEDPSTEGSNVDRENQKTGQVAFSLAPFGLSIDPSIVQALSPVGAALEELGWQVAETYPDLMPLDPYADLVRGLSALQVKAALRPDLNQVGKSFSSAVASGLNRNLEELADFHAVQARVWQETVAFFDRYDFALWPTTTGLAFAADLTDGEIREDWRTVTLTPLLQLPSLSLPCGKSSDGLPVGLHITGPRGSDARLLAFAARLEQLLQGACLS